MIAGPIELIKKSFKIFFKKENFIFFLKIYLPVFILSLLSLWSQNNGATSELEQGNFEFFLDKPYLAVSVALLFIIGLILGIWFTAVSLEAVIRVVNSGSLQFKDTYKKAWSYALKLVLASFLVGLIVLGGLILLVIPGIIFGTWYSLVRFGVAEKGLGIRASLKESKSLVSGRFWKVFGRLIVFGLFGLIGQIVLALVPYIGPSVFTIFGALFLLPYYLLYQELARARA